MGMLKKICLGWVLMMAVIACREQPPEVIIDPIMPPEPSIHIIDNYYYVQYTLGRQRDTFTYEILDDTTQWADTTWYNYVHEVRSDEIYDTVGAEDLEDYDERMKIGYTYAPTTTVLRKRYHEILFPGAEDPIPDPEEVEEFNDDYFSLQFPFSDLTDTVAFWDIEDYLNNPSLEAPGLIRWGRVGNNELEDTIWNNDARPGVVISYTDTAGVEWRSDNWPTFQPYGYFKLETIEPNFRDNQSYDIISGEFAARLYNDQQAYIDMYYGRFRLRILGDIELSPEPK
jgi:hypothetical protein